MIQARARPRRALIHDSEYSDREYDSRRGWGHSSVRDTLAFAQPAGPERRPLFHHDPSHDHRRPHSLAEEATEEASRLCIASRRSRRRPYRR